MSVKGASFRTADIVRQTLPPPRPMQSQDDKFLSPSVGTIPLTMFDIYSLTGKDTFIWDTEGNGWDQGYWAGYPEKLVMFLLGDLGMRTGYGAASYLRSGTTTRINRNGGTDDVAEDMPPFDWMEGPSERDRYCFRVEGDSTLLLPSLRNISRREGSFTCWVQPSISGTDVNDRTICGNFQFRLYIPAGTETLRFSADTAGAASAASHNISAWNADEWHFVGCSWSYPGNEVCLWVDGVQQDSDPAPLRFTEPDDYIALGCDTDGTNQWVGYLADFRIWPQFLTEEAASTMYRVGA